MKTLCSGGQTAYRTRKHKEYLSDRRHQRSRTAIAIRWEVYDHSASSRLVETHDNCNRDPKGTHTRSCKMPPINLYALSLGITNGLWARLLLHGVGDQKPNS